MVFYNRRDIALTFARDRRSGTVRRILDFANQSKEEGTRADILFWAPAPLRSVITALTVAIRKDSKRRAKLRTLFESQKRDKTQRQQFEIMERQRVQEEQDEAELVHLTLSDGDEDGSQSDAAEKDKKTSEAEESSNNNNNDKNEKANKKLAEKIDKLRQERALRNEQEIASLFARIDAEFTFEDFLKCERSDDDRKFIHADSSSSDDDDDEVENPNNLLDHHQDGANNNNNDNILDENQRIQLRKQRRFQRKNYSPALEQQPLSKDVIMYVLSFLNPSKDYDAFGWRNLSLPPKLSHPRLPPEQLSALLNLRAATVAAAVVGSANSASSSSISVAAIISQQSLLQPSFVNQDSALSALSSSPPSSTSIIIPPPSQPPQLPRLYRCSLYPPKDGSPKNLLIVRVLTPHRYVSNEELNMFLGRYGFVNSEPLSPDGFALSEAEAAAATQQSGHRTGTIRVLLFLVTVDSPQVAVRAVESCLVAQIDYLSWAVQVPYIEENYVAMISTKNRKKNNNSKFLPLLLPPPSLDEIERLKKFDLDPCVFPVSCLPAPEKLWLKPLVDVGGLVRRRKYLMLQNRTIVSDGLLLHQQHQLELQQQKQQQQQGNNNSFPNNASSPNLPASNSNKNNTVAGKNVSSVQISKSSYAVGGTHLSSLMMMNAVGAVSGGGSSGNTTSTLQQLVDQHQQQQAAGGVGVGMMMMMTHEDDANDDDGLGDIRMTPEIIVDGFPYWTTDEMLLQRCAEFGTVRRIRFSSSDRSGVHYGCAAVTMGSVAEAVKLHDGLHGRVIEGAAVVCGILEAFVEQQEEGHDDEDDEGRLIRKQNRQIISNNNNNGAVLGEDEAVGGAEETGGVNGRGAVQYVLVSLRTGEPVTWEE